MATVILDNNDIDIALKDYVAKMGLSLEGKDVEVKLTVGRKKEGATSASNSATVEITDAPMNTTPDPAEEQPELSTQADSDGAAEEGAIGPADSQETETKATPEADSEESPTKSIFGKKD